MTYLDYKDEQKRYPKASAKFIRAWFEKHISPADATIAEISTAVDEAMDTEDISEETSSESRSPANRADSSSATSDDEEVQVFEKVDKTMMEKGVGS